jgi:uncharacterized OB-fold protein
VTAPLVSPPVPVPDPDSRGFWEALQGGSLAVARCADCRRWQHPPTEDCRLCGGALSFEPVSGRGTVYSFITVRQALVPGHQTPYTIGLVALEEQDDIRITGVVRGPVEDVRVGLPVTVAVAQIGTSGYNAPEWSPA